MLEHTKPTIEVTPPSDSSSSDVLRIAEKEAGSRLLQRILPSALIMGALVGIAYWGHQTGWRIGNADSNALAGKPEDTLSVVRATGRDAYAWCPAHGVHGCPLDFPEVAQLEKARSIVPADFERVQRALTVRPRRENDPKFPFAGARLRFTSREALNRAPVDMAPASEARIVETINASGEIQFDPTRMARLTSRAAGTVRHVAKNVGDSVQAGEVLALVDAADVGKGKAEFLQALVQARLKKKAWENLKNAGTSIPDRQLREAEAALRDADTRLVSAEQGLTNLGLPIRATELGSISIDEVARRITSIGIPQQLFEQLSPDLRTSNLLAVRAPMDGVVLSRDVISGEVVDVNKILFVIVDARQISLILHIATDDVRFVHIGADVMVHPDGQRDVFRGKIAWIGTSADDSTRSVPVRVEVPNPDGRLRASTLGTGRIILREEPNAVLVPSEAVHELAGCEVVFIRQNNFFADDGPKEFIVRTVRTGAREVGNTEIIVGVQPEEVVAAKGSVMLLNDLKKTQESQR